jgi:hypothetical protein
MKSTPKFIQSLGATIVENERTAMIRAPIEHVWELVGSHEGICRWDPLILSMTPLTDGPQRIGSSYHVRSRAGVGDKIMEHVEQVVDLEPLARRTIRSERPFITFEVATRLTRADNLTLCTYHSRVWLYGHMRLLKRIVHVFGEKNIREALQGLKTFIANERSEPAQSARADAPARAAGNGG